MKKYLSNYPDLIKELHPTKNGDLKPEFISHGSGKKIWWICSKGDEYDLSIQKRTLRGDSCPFCSGKRVNQRNSFKSNYPKIAKNWHPTKNGNLKPEDFTLGSSKLVFWKCLKNHSYQRTIKEQVKRNGKCQTCFKEENNFQNKFPTLSLEWHPTKNSNIFPSEVSYGSKKRVWWKCPKSDLHDYFVSPNYRSSGTGCPFCGGKKVCADNNLEYLYPNIASEWHPSKNGNLKPNQILSKTDKSYYWLCPKNHVYKARCADRTGKLSGCPRCTRQSSEPEIRILTECMYIFKNVISRHKIDGVEVDIFIPEFNLAIEYDGSFFHKNSKEKDLTKNKFLKSNSIHLIRVRHHPLTKLSHNDLIVKNEILKKLDLNIIIKEISKFSKTQNIDKIKEYMTKTKFLNDKLFRKYISYFPSPFPDKSLLITHPDISKEWDYKGNFPLKPDNFTYGSRQSVLWLCKKGHSYPSTISSRTGNKKSGCSFCSGQRVGKDNNLEYLYPNIASEWHPLKNGDLKPSLVTKGSNKKVWWKCSINSQHEWDANIYDRVSKKTGCPICLKEKRIKIKREKFP